MLLIVPFPKLCKQKPFLLHGRRVISFSIFRSGETDMRRTVQHFQKCFRSQTFPKIFRDAAHVRQLWTSAKVLGIYETGKH